MKGGCASVIRRQLEASELLSVVVRLIVLCLLAVLYLATARVPGLEYVENLVVAVAVVAAVAYSVLALQLVARGRYRPSLVAVSAVLDSLCASAFLWVSLWGAGAPHTLLAGASALALAVATVTAASRPLEWGVLAGAAAGAVAASATVLPAIGGGAAALGAEWALVPLGAVLLGAVAVLASRRTRITLEQNLATDELRLAARRLGQTVEGLRGSAAGLTEMGAELERAMAAVAEGARSQGGNVERISRMVASSDAAQEQLAVSGEAAAATVGRAVGASETARETVERVVDRILGLSATIDRVAASLDLLRGLSNSSSVLAMSAGIEASRGGAESKGFAEVADEIRKLSEQSQGAVVETVRLLKQAGAVVTAAQGWSREAGEVFAEVGRELGGLVELAGKTGAAAQAQLKTNREVERSAAQIADAATEQTRSAARLRETAGTLEREAARLRALVEGRYVEKARLAHG